MTHSVFKYVFFVSLALAAENGSAAPKSDAGAIKQADELYRDARTLMAQSRFAEACPKLLDSQRLDAGIGTLLTLGECYEANGDFPSAAATFAEAEDEAKQKNDPRSQLAAERLARLLRRVARLRVLLPAENLDTNVTIAMDGVPLAASPHGRILYLAPGEHRLEVHSDGKRSWSNTVTTLAGAAVVDILVPALEPEASTSSQLPPVEPRIAAPASSTALPASGPTSADHADQGEPEPAAGSRFPTRKTAAVALGGLGVVGAGIGTWLLISGQSKEADADKFCNGEDSSRCTQAGVDLIHEAKRLDTAGSIVLGTSIAAVVAGTVLYVTAAPRDRGAQRTGFAWQPLLLPGTAGMVIRGRY